MEKVVSGRQESGFTLAILTRINNKVQQKWFTKTKMYLKELSKMETRAAKVYFTIHQENSDYRLITLKVSRMVRIT